jgi:hypothetical protein
MIRKSGARFSEKIMLRQNASAIIDSTENNFALAPNEKGPDDVRASIKSSTEAALTSARPWH